ncbi:hypothetical protein LCGC14_0537460 [marine sediment metagenome]|uniref:Uncharacterized protein n=1 Tax=marine sediment metagenome TaxID=412755 RepID=A0A0F9UFB1_9ZZZZ
MMAKLPQEVEEVEEKKEKIKALEWPEGPEIVSEACVKKATTTSVREMLDRVHGKIDEFGKEVDGEFEKELEKQVKAKRNGCFIVRNRYWDQWLQKLFSQSISIKVWIITLITILLCYGLITSIQFASILGIITGMKGVFSAADVWKRKGTIDIIDRV